MMNSEARKRAAGIAASNPTAPEVVGTLEGAPGADSEALAARDAVTHVMRWTYDGDSAVAEAVCLAPPDADCRLEPVDHNECRCELWGRIERREDGTIWHALTDGYRDLTLSRDNEQWHQVRPSAQPADSGCNVVLSINESGGAEELTPEGEHHEFVIADIPFEPVWENDGCSWRPLSTLSSSWLADHDRQIAERAWDEGARAEYDFERGEADDIPVNPYSEEARRG